VVSGKWHREHRRQGVYTSGTAVCVAQMGINFYQSDAAFTIFPSGTGAATNQSVNPIYNG